MPAQVAWSSFRYRRCSCRPRRAEQPCREMRCDFARHHRKQPCAMVVAGPLGIDPRPVIAPGRFTCRRIGEDGRGGSGRNSTRVGIGSLKPDAPSHAGETWASCEVLSGQFRPGIRTSNLPARPGLAICEFGRAPCPSASALVLPSLVPLCAGRGMRRGGFANGWVGWGGWVVSSRHWDFAFLRFSGFSFLEFCEISRMGSN